MDDRSFREKSGSKNRFAHWGEEQERWMLGQVANHSGFAWIMNGSQIFPSMPFKESLSKEHKENLKGTMSDLSQLATKVAFVSGDVHYSEISKIEKERLGYTTFEFTSSGLHSPNFPGAPDIIPNWRRIASTGRRNYVLIDSYFTGKCLYLDMRSRGLRGQTHFSRTLSI